MVSFHSYVHVYQRVSIIYPRKSRETPNEYHKFYVSSMLDRKSHCRVVKIIQIYCCNQGKMVTSTGKT